MGTPVHALRVFISYRRSDSQEFVRPLATVIERELPGTRVFVDESGIQVGRFPQQLADQLATCHLMLVVIGPTWLSSFQERSSQEGLDWVLHEVTEALRTDKYIIPVLVDDVKRPEASELPEALRSLPVWQTYRVRKTSLEADAQALAGWIRSLDVAATLRARDMERSARDLLGDTITRLLAATRSARLDVRRLRERARELHLRAEYAPAPLDSEQRALFESAARLVSVLRETGPEVWALASRSTTSVLDPAVVGGQAFSEVSGALLLGEADRYMYENLARVFRTTEILLDITPHHFEDSLAPSDTRALMRPPEASRLVTFCDGRSIEAHFASDTGLLTVARTLRARASRLEDVQIRITAEGGLRIYARDDRTIYRWALSDGRLERECLIPDPDVRTAFSGLRVWRSSRVEFVCWSRSTSWIKYADRPELVALTPPGSQHFKIDNWREALEDDEGVVFASAYFGGQWDFPARGDHPWSKILVWRFSWLTGTFGPATQWDVDEILRPYAGTLGQTEEGDARRLLHAFYVWPVLYRHRRHLVVACSIKPRGHALFLVDERTGSCYWPPIIERGVFQDVVLLTQGDRELLVAVMISHPGLHAWDLSNPREPDAPSKVATWQAERLALARMGGEAGTVLAQAFDTGGPGSRLLLLTAESGRFVNWGAAPGAQLASAMRLQL